jgi:uncharacterized zinc-type alcohol dehydrogenase-like protein
MSLEVNCIAAFDKSGELRAHRIERRALRSNDVRVAIKYAGICRSDLHTIRSEWGPPIYPVVPGHEIAGIVEEVGSDVTKFTVGQRVGVGCMVNSCLECDACQNHEEQYCKGGCVWTYNSLDVYADNTPTYGGYSTHIVAREEFVCSIPDSLELNVAAPLLCAGITLYSPAKRYAGLEGGKTIGIVGLGGLGHMGIKILKALGHTVVVMSTSDRKREKAMELGADHFVIVNDEIEVSPEFYGMCDAVLDTAAAIHELPRYFKILKHRGSYVCIGAPEVPYKLHFFNLHGVNLCSSLIGGLEETQEMLEFCAEHNILPDIQIISGDQVNNAMEELTWNKNDKSRFVIDVATIDGREVAPYPPNSRCGCGEDCECGNVCLCDSGKRCCEEGESKDEETSGVQHS